MGVALINRSYELSTEDTKYTLTPDMLSIKKYKKTIHGGCGHMTSSLLTIIINN